MRFINSLFHKVQKIWSGVDASLNTDPSKVVEIAITLLDDKPGIFEILPSPEDSSVVIIRVKGNIDSTQIALTGKSIWLFNKREKYFPSLVEKYALVTAVQRWINQVN